MVNDIVLTYTQHVERENYFKFCQINGYQPNKGESIIIWGNLMRGIKNANRL